MGQFGGLDSRLRGHDILLQLSRSLLLPGDLGYFVKTARCTAPGYGILGPFAAAHNIRFSSSAGALSYPEKSIVEDCLAPGVLTEFFAYRSTFGLSTLNAVMLAFLLKQLNIGVAPASY